MQRFRRRQLHRRLRTFRSRLSTDGSGNRSAHYRVLILLLPLKKKIAILRRTLTTLVVIPLRSIPAFEYYAVFQKSSFYFFALEQ